MRFYCRLEFKNIDQPNKRCSAHFIMGAKGWNDIQSKLSRCGDSAIFHGWDFIGSNATINRIEGLSGCFCTYSKQRGFRGTFKMSPIWGV